MQNKKFAFWLTIIHLPFFIYQLWKGNYYLDDSKEYIFAGENILNSFTLYAGDLSKTIQPDLYTKRPPLYPVFLIIGFLNPYLIVVFQNILSIIGISILRKNFQTLGYNTKNDFLLLFLIATSISYFIYTNMIMSEALFGFIIILIIHYAFAYFKKPSISSLTFLFVFLALSILVKPVFYPLSFVMFIIFLLLHKNYIHVKRIAICSIPIVMVISIALINKNRTGVFHYSSIQRINLIDYNVNYFLINKKGPSFASTFNDSIKKISLAQEYPNRYQTEETAAKNIIKQNIVSYSLFHVKGALRMFLDPGRFDLSNFFEINKNKEVGFLKIINEKGLIGVISYLKNQNLIFLILLILVFAINLIRLGCFVSYFIFSLKQRNNFSFLFVSLFICYIALITGPIGASRFIVPILMVLNFITIFQMQYLFSFFKKKRLLSRN